MVLIFGGTTEGRKAAEVLEQAGKPYYYSTKTGEQEQAFGRAFAQELGQPATGQGDFSKFTYDELNHAVQRLAQRGIRGGFSPVVDGTILPQHPFEPASPESKDVPCSLAPTSTSSPSTSAAA